MKSIQKFRTVLILLAILVHTPAQSQGGNKTLLSLRIAEATKEQRRMTYYKSVVRQQKNRPQSGSKSWDALIAEGNRLPTAHPPPSSAR